MSMSEELLMQSVLAPLPIEFFSTFRIVNIVWSFSNRFPALRQDKMICEMDFKN